jgi:hypothetical protein
LTANKYVTRNTVSDIIENVFCPEAAADTALGQASSGSFSRTFLNGTMEQIIITITWQSGPVNRPDLSTCQHYLRDVVLDGCDGNNPNNPMNWKGGGALQVGNISYSINPTTVRQPPPKQAGGGCKMAYKALYDAVTIWGNGWENSTFGAEIQSQLKDRCALLPNTWEFSYGLGPNGREWTATARVGVFQKKCVGDNLHNAGAPQGMGCSGSG